MSNILDIDDAPTIISIDGRPFYQFSDRILPVISGSSDDDGDEGGEGEGEDDDKSDDSDDGDDDDKSDGDDKEKEDAKVGDKKSDDKEKLSDLEVRRILRGKKKTDKENLQLKEQIRTLAEAQAKGENKPADDAELERLRIAAKEEGKGEAETVWKKRTVKQAARVALFAAGLEGSPDKLLRMLDLDDIEVDDDGEIDGLEDQIDELKEEFPDRFPEKTKTEPGEKKVPKRVDNGDKNTNVQKKSTAQILADRLGG